MELRDYIAALRRHWHTWVGVTLAAVAIAVAVVVLTPRTYEATAQVFVSSSGEGASTPQFVSQRVKSYPDVALSAAVLEPAERSLGLHTGLQQLRQQVSASNPVDTSQINVVATTGDPQSAAALANAVAQQFTGVVQKLEQPGSGRSPVTLTVTSPATVPTAPASPQTAYLLVLGTLVGLFLGLAAAVVHSRMDTRVYADSDVRSAWGADDDLTVLSTPRRRKHRRRLRGRPAGVLARRLELIAETTTAQIAVLSPAPDEQAAARRLADDVVEELDRLGVPGAVGDAPDRAARATGGTQRVHLEMADPLASLRGWRSVAERTDGVVLVVPSGRVDAAELSEMRTVLGEAGLTTLAVVVTRPTRRSRRRRDPRPATGGRPADRAGGPAARPADRAATDRPPAAELVTAAPRR